jgi:hypothetical protein
VFEEKMSTTGRSSKRAFCLAAVVTLALATAPSPSFALVLRSQQERLPAELSLDRAGAGRCRSRAGI